MINETNRLIPTHRGLRSSRPASAAASLEDAWARREEALFERLAVSWTIAGLPLEEQKMLLARYRMASPDERRWVRETIAAHLARGLAVCAFNAAYDFSLLDAECRRYGLDTIDARPVIDPMVIDRRVDRFRRGKRTLTVATEVYGVELLDAHDASADAIAAGYAPAASDALTHCGL